MSIPQGIWTVAVLVGLSAWVYAAWALRQMARRLPRLDQVDAPPREHGPTVSLVIPACNEADTLEAAVRSRLAQDSPNLELVLVDDRSTDGTSAVVDRLAAQDARVRAVHITTLPEGWLGKLHALHQGARAARGDWLLFTDADVHFTPDTVRRALAHCEARGLDFLTAMPRMERAGFLLDAVIATFVRILAVSARLHRVEDPASSASAGGGVFNLVRRDVFARSPGFEYLKLEVADDAALGHLLKTRGARCGVVNAVHNVSVRFYASLGDMARGLEKNAFAVLGRFSHPRLWGVCAVFLLLELSPVLALLPCSPPWLRVVGVGALLGALALCASAARLFRVGLLPALAFPLAAPLFGGFMLRSGWMAWRRGGIAWRGTLYPTALLREGARSPMPF